MSKSESSQSVIINHNIIVTLYDMIYVMLYDVSRMLKKEENEKKN